MHIYTHTQIRDCVDTCEQKEERENLQIEIIYLLFSLSLSRSISSVWTIYQCGARAPCTELFFAFSLSLPRAVLIHPSVVFYSNDLLPVCIDACITGNFRRKYEQEEEEKEKEQRDE